MPRDSSSPDLGMSNNQAGDSAGPIRRGVLASLPTSRSGLSVSLALLGALSCGGTQVPKTQEVSGATQWPVGGQAVEIETPARQTAHQLAGDWKLSMWSRSHGTVVGTLHLEETGHGRYVVTATGFRRSGDLRVTAWDGQWLEGTALGFRKRLRATMRGNILYVELPIVGEITLIRHNWRGGAVQFSGS